MKKISKIILGLVLFGMISFDVYGQKRELNAQIIKKQPPKKQQESAEVAGMRQQLREAIEKGHAVCVAKCLGVGADPNSTDITDITPLLVASYKGNEAIVSMLLRAGADVNKAGSNGVTPLIQASFSDY